MTPLSDPTWSVKESGLVATKNQNMTTKAEGVLKLALELPDGERAEIAAKLIESLEPEGREEVQAAWSEEIASRVAAIDSGEAQFVTWEDLKDLLSRRRSSR